jgi:hypothetical protein
MALLSIAWFDLPTIKSGFRIRNYIYITPMAKKVKTECTTCGKGLNTDEIELQHCMKCKEDIKSTEDIEDNLGMASGASDPYEAPIALYGRGNDSWIH